MACYSITRSGRFLFASCHRYWTWDVNLDKSSLVPSQNFEYLGLHFVTILDLVRPANHLLVKLESKVLELCAQHRISPRKLQEFLRLVKFFTPLIRLGCLHMRMI